MGKYKIRSLVTMERWTILQSGRGKFDTNQQDIRQECVIDIVSLLADGRVMSNRSVRRLDPLGDYRLEHYAVCLTTWKKGREAFINEYCDKNAGWATV